MKRFLILIILLTAGVLSFAQGSYTNTYQTRYFTIPKASDTTAVVANDGRMWYDFVTDEFRGIKNGSRFSFASAADIGGNFWPLNGDGTQTANVHIDGGGFDWTWDNGNATINANDGIGGGILSLGAGDLINITATSIQTQQTTSLSLGNMTGDFSLEATAGGSSSILALSKDNGSNFTGMGISLTGQTGQIGEVFFDSDDLFGHGIGFVLNDRRATPFGWQYDAATYAANGPYETSDMSLTSRSYVLGAKTFTDGATQTMNPNGTNSGLNVGIQAGDPLSLINGDLFYNSSLGALRARIGGSTVSLGTGTIGGTIASTQVGYGSGANTMTSESAFTYNATTDALTVPTITNSGLTTVTSVSNDVLVNGGDDIILQASDDINASGTDILMAGSATMSLQGGTSITIDAPSTFFSTMTATRVPFFGTSGLLDDDNGMTYTDATNLFEITSTGGANLTQVFGGEIQIEDVGGSDQLVINDEGLQFSGTTSPPQIVNATGSQSVVMLDNVVYTSTASSGNVGTGNTTIYTFSLPAATLFTDGQALVVEVWFEIANNTNVKSVTITVGGTQVASTGTLNVATQDFGKIVSTVTRTGATTAKSVNEYVTQGTTKFSGTTDLDFTSGASITWGNANTVNIVAASATASNDIIGFYAKAYYVAQ